MKDKFLTILILSFSLMAFDMPLSQYSNYYIHETKSGEVFIGSYEGINIYDGVSVRKYYPTTHNMVGKITQSDFFEDKNGNVWFANYQGINKYNRKKDDFEPIQFRNPYTDELIQLNYRIIRLDGGKLTLLADAFIFQYDIEAQTIDKWFEINTDKYFLFNISTVKNKDRIIAIGNRGAIQIHLDTSWNTCSTSRINNTINYSMDVIDDQTIVVGLYTGDVIIYNLTDNSEIKRIHLGNQPINKVEKITEEEFLISQASVGIYLYNFKSDTRRFILTPKEIGIPEPKLTTHHLSKNVLWYCIEGKGCFNKDLSTNNFQNNLNILDDANKYGHLIPQKNGILATVLGNNTPRYYHATNKTYSRPMEIPINVLSKFENNTSLAISDHEVLQSQHQNFESLHPKDLVITNCKNVVYVESNSYLLNNKSNLFLCSIFDDTYQLSPIKNQLFEDAIVIGIERISESFLTSVEEVSISSFKLKRDSAVIEHNYPITGVINAVYEETDSFYLATRSGLFKCDKHTSSFRSVIDNNKYLQQTLYSILPDSRGNIWLSSNSGIIQFIPKTNETFLFDTRHGLPGNEFNTYSYCVGVDGRFYFGGQSGLISFHPDSLKLSNKESQIHISSFQVNGISYKKQSPFTLDAVELPFDENRLSFGFHSIDYSNGETKTKYKMSDIDNTWIENNNTTGMVTYPKLSPGNYTFSIIGSNADGVWSEKSKNIHITIHPPWWATWWARTLGFLLLSGLIYILFRSYYKRQLREKELQLREANLTIEKQKALSEERTRIASDMHDDLGGGLTTIKFLSQKALRKTEDKNIKALISKIANQSESLVNNMSEIIWAMNARFDTLQSLISYCRRYAYEYLEDYDINIRFNQEGESTNLKISGIERRNIFLAVKECLHNIVKHAKAQNVTISILVSDKLTIRVIDDGIGLKKSNEFGNGLLNMQKRIHTINGILHITSAQKGTQVEISIDLDNLKNTNTLV